MQAEDFSDADDSFEITTAPEDFDAVHKALEEQNIPMASAEVTMIPQTYVTLTDEADITNIGRILDFLDDDDDVQEDGCLKCFGIIPKFCMSFFAILT
jgi:transcriptional/translational regulatory protein YebC/TACO1